MPLWGGGSQWWAGHCAALWGYFPHIGVLKAKGWHSDVCRGEIEATVTVGGGGHPQPALKEDPYPYGAVQHGETEARRATPLLRLHVGDGCGHTVLTAQSGTLSSRNYPGTYPNHTVCHWQLRAPPGTSLIVAFGDVDLESSERCAHSSLLLADPESGAAYGKGETEAAQRGADRVT